MPVCANIIANERPFLSEDDQIRILKRYRSHVEFWNSNQAAIQSELQTFANALGESYWQIEQLYNSLNWVGLIRHQCGVNILPWGSALQANGFEYKTWAGQVTGKCYILVRSREHGNASTVIQSQYWQTPFEFVQPWEQVV